MADHADDAAHRRTESGSWFDGSPVADHPSKPTRPIPGDSDYEPGSFAELVDSVLVRIDRLRDRPLASLTVMTLLGMVVAAAWWFGRPGPVLPLEERIPMAGTSGTTDDVASDLGAEAVVSVGEGAVGEVGAEVQYPAAADAPAPEDGRQAAVHGASSSGPVGAGQPRVRPSGGAVAEPVDHRVIIHISGEVVTQGLVELASGARIADAIAAAGGPTPTADIHRLNLAAAVIDGMHVRVPALGADPAEPLIETVPGTAAHDPALSHWAQGGTPGSPGPVDINRADAAELEILPGIGPTLAQAIIRWRNENGGFAAADDLLLVPGIGPAKLAALTDLITT